ncbi:MAG: hypothetical protein AB9869_11415 [Verrucomicrobiia bacterium]
MESSEGVGVLLRCSWTQSRFAGFFYDELETRGWGGANDVMVLLQETGLQVRATAWKLKLAGEEQSGSGGGVETDAYLMVDIPRWCNEREVRSLDTGSSAPD